MIKRGVQPTRGYKGRVPAEGSGVSPNSPNLPSRLGAGGLKASRAQFHTASRGHSPPLPEERLWI